MAIISNVSNIHPEAIWGFAFDEENPDPLEIFLYVNGKHIATTLADTFRQGVLELGLHPTGHCGFSFPLLRNHFFLPTDALIELKAGPRQIDLKGSPCHFQVPQAPIRKSILIVGLAKSGTSILTYSLASSIGDAYISFEPGKGDTLYDTDIHQWHLAHFPLLVSKCLFIIEERHRIAAIGDLYQQKIWIRRDPRDRMISGFLYGWRRNFFTHLHLRLEKTLKMLQKKEANPASVPFHTLLRPNEVQYFCEMNESLLNAYRKLPASWFKLRYEDFLTGNTHELEKYLGFKVNTQAEVDPKYARVARSKGYDNWRKWFTPEDVAFFRPLFTASLEALGYDSSDWELAHPDSLPAEEGSAYVARLVREVCIEEGMEIPPYLQ